MNRTFLASLVLGPVLLLAALLLPGIAAAAGPITSTACAPGATPATVTCNLWAKPGSLSLPATTVTVWGFSDTSGGSPSLPGPTLVVDQGDVVTVNLTNNLGQPTSILFDGQAMAPDQAGVVAGGSKAYTFTAGAPGTYLYEAGLIPGSQYQVSMGLFGTLIVRPTGHPTGLPGQAYGDASTAFDDEALVVLSEIDPALNNSATPWAVDLRAFAPKYFLVNGTAYTSAAPAIATTSGNTLLLRYANAGIQHHSIGVLGLHQAVLSVDGSEAPYPRTMVAETIAPGQSADVLITMPAATAASTKYALYDAAMTFNNSSASGVGGMLAFIDASGTAGGDTVGPLTSAVTMTETAPGSGVYTLTATVDDTTTGAANVAAAEYRIDSTSAAPTALAAVDLSFNDQVSEAVTSVSGAIDTTSWTSGTHAIYVRGQDSLGNWGAYASATIVLDTAGPITSALVLNPNPSNGSVPLALSGTASDSATGNGNVVAAEYFVGARGANGSGSAMTLNKTAPVVSLTATVLPSGPSTGTVTTSDLTGLVLTDSSATFQSDGLLPGLRVVNTTDGSAGTVLTVDSETQITLVAALTGGVANGFALGNAYAIDHPVSVHSKDAAGNWGPFVMIPLVIDNAGPATSNVAASPNPNNGKLGQSSSNPSVRVTAAFNDSASGGSTIAAAEGFIDTLGANGTGFPFVANDGIFNAVSETGRADIPLTTINLLAVGNHTIYVHGRDALGNWGAAASIILVIDKAGPTTSGLGLNPSAANGQAVAISAAADDLTTGDSNIVAGEYFIDTTTGADGSGTALSVGAASPSTTLSGTIPAARVAALAVGNHTVYVHARDAAGNWGGRVSTTLLIDRTSPTFTGISLAPNPTAGATSVTLTVLGSADVGGSGVTGGEWWFGTSNPAAGGGTAFSGLTASIPTAICPGSYTVRARIHDGAGNWSSGTSGVRGAALTVTRATPVAPAIFSDGFELGTSLPCAWTSRSTTTATRLSVTTAAALAGTNGLQAQGNNTNYVQFNFATLAMPAAATYDARFLFNPNGNASTGHEILRTASATSFSAASTLARVRYRQSVGQGQVQIQVGTANTNTTWTDVNNASSNTIEIVWQAVGSGGPNPGTLALYVNGVLAQTLATTSTGSVTAVRMGSVTTGSSAIVEYFDDFVSKSSVSPLVGP